MSHKPIVLISCNRISYDGLPAHLVRETYLRAVHEVAGCVPLLVPALPEAFDFDSVSSVVGGILLTGSPSHVCPKHYGAVQAFDDCDLDIPRDDTAMPLIRKAMEKDIPLLAICRGFQEMNVVCGGRLHQYLHTVEGNRDHRSSKEKTLLQNYEAQAHSVSVQKGGLFERWGLPKHFPVNSLHTQGVAEVGQGLFVEALAPDGVVEAFSLPQKKFMVGTQWHPEGNYAQSLACRRIFEEFGRAIKA